MGLLQDVAVAAIQAATSVLPVGSSGHRAVLPGLLGWNDLSPGDLLAIYIGILMALAGYLWRDLAALGSGAVQLARGRRGPEARLLIHLVAASLPIVAAVAAAGAIALPVLSTATAIGWISVVFGFALLIGDRIGVTLRRLDHMTMGAALAIGVIQLLTAIPGAGRPGLNVTVARFLGFERIAAARLSLLLALPPLVCAIVLAARELARVGNVAFAMSSAIAGVAAFVVALVAASGLIGWLRDGTFLPFALYRIAAGAALLVWVYLH
ncbi:MAG: undecaprenyl-diphosphate phosphatase [Gemmatimonas sp.]